MLAEIEPVPREKAANLGGPKLLSGLSRITTAGRNFIPQIDGLRFIAIMAVIAYHVRGVCLYHFGLDPAAGAAPTGLVSRTFQCGHYGVQLFFAISGFILSLPFARQNLCQKARVSLRGYYLRRVTRIEPPYVIHLVFLLLLCIFVYRRLPAHSELFHNPAWLIFTLQHLGSSLFYANGFIFGAHPYPNYVLWSLEVEVQFYLLAPFLAKIFLIHTTSLRRALLLSLIIVGSLTGFFGETYRVWASLAGNLQYFLVGFLLTDLYVSGRLNGTGRSYKWDFAFLLSGAAVVCAEGKPGMMALLPLAIFVCGLAAFRSAITSRFLANPWITTIGGMCYTIYLYHPILISFIVRLTTRLRTHILSLDLLVQFLVMSLVIVGICAVLFAWLERPFMRRDWPTRLGNAVRAKWRMKPGV